jgi:hypothetical protein
MKAACAGETVIDEHKPGRGMSAEMPRYGFTFAQNGFAPAAFRLE